MKVGNLFAYQIMPMDFGWEHFSTIDEHVARLVKADEDMARHQREFGSGVREFYEFLNQAMDAARKVGWEGDFRIGPRVGVIAASDSPETFVVWKQDNNGDTYVVSPVELPHLRDSY